jgi:hypothetical protein
VKAKTAETIGQLIAIDVDTLDYEIGTDILEISLARD